MGNQEHLQQIGTDLLLIIIKKRLHPLSLGINRTGFNQKQSKDLASEGLVVARHARVLTCSHGILTKTQCRKKKSLQNKIFKTLSKTTTTKAGIKIS